MSREFRDKFSGEFYKIFTGEEHKTFLGAVAQEPEERELGVVVDDGFERGHGARAVPVDHNGNVAGLWFGGALDQDQVAGVEAEADHGIAIHAEDVIAAAELKVWDEIFKDADRSLGRRGVRGPGGGDVAAERDMDYNAFRQFFSHFDRLSANGIF